MTRRRATMKPTPICSRVHTVDSLDYKVLRCSGRGVHFGAAIQHTYTSEKDGQVRGVRQRIKGLMRKSGCPCLRAEEEEVRVLDYRHCGLDNVPADVFNWERTLEELYVDANQIRDLPRELFYCHGLRRMNLSDNEITAIPPAIASLIHLEHLDISKNGIVDLPDSIKCCKYLATVEASVNPLGKLPEGFTQLLNLSELYLNDTFLDYLPGSFGRLSKLKILEVRENHLKTLPKSVSRLTALERLDIGNNEFTELPEVVGALTSLLELWCDCNQISRFPKSIGQLKQLMFVDASKNRVECLPSEIDGCLSLADLHLSINLLQQLPENIGRLSNLTTLKVDDNRLTSLPFSIGGLVSLSELNISANDLEELPPSIGFLRHLRTLYADENFLYDIPPELGSCNGLTVMSFRSNNLMYVPDEIGRIPRLRVLNLSDNKIRCLPYSLTRLKELQALWLSENQTKPLIRLQPDIDIDTGQRMLTCYLLPQQPQDDNDDMYSDHGSFHPSLWEEERKERQRIHFDFEDVEEQSRLERTPTPYPKEMKHRMQHMRNLALKQLNLPNGTVRSGPDPGGGTTSTAATAGGTTAAPSADRSTQEDAKANKAVSPLMAERRHLLRADKEKNTKDKVRMAEQRRSQDERRGNDNKGVTAAPGETPKKVSERDEGGFKNPTDAACHQSRDSTQPAQSVSKGTSANLTNLQHSGSHGNHGSTSNMGPSCVSGGPTFADFSRGLSVSDGNRGAVGHHGRAPPSHRPTSGHELTVRSHPSHSANHRQYYPHGSYGRTRGYESDTGYRSDTHSDVGYRSDTGYRMHRGGRGDGYSSDFEVLAHGRGRMVARRDGYASDLEAYVPGRKHYPNVFRPPGGQHHHHNLRPPSGSHRSHGAPSGSNSKNQVYSNAPFFRRNNIKNDELYEQQCMAPMPSHPPSKSPSLRTLPEVAGRGGESPHRGSQNINQSCTEDKSGSNDDELWKAQLYKASVKLQKTPSDKRKQMQNPVVETKPNESSDSVFVSPPPYQPAPPYTPPKPRDSLPGPGGSDGTPMPSMDIPALTSSPRSVRSFGGRKRNESPRSSGTPSHVPDDGQTRLSGSYGSPQGASEPTLVRPNTLPLNSQDHLAPLTPRSGHIPDGRPQCMPNQSPRTPRSHQGQVMTADKSRTPRRSYDPARPGDFKSPLDTMNISQTPLDTPLRLTQYEKDVAVFKQMEPPSQVSSSTDSGYGHHIYEKMPGQDGLQPSPTPRGHSPPSPHLGGLKCQQYRSSPSRDSAVGMSRESTPGQGTDHAAPDGQTGYIDGSPSKMEVFRLTINKNPGLGFSIAGGIGSPGNPFRPGDEGIFITKVQDKGPAGNYLRRGDKILEVNGIDFTSIDHTEAVGVLRTSGQTVALYIERR